eukprot:TRINITY_DN9613_c0_g1_i1.p1 TRINITY_DN9613_c0_g1~~TRINITY_DN9613_c0_g1_i1.p1  ORF type:complete len:110 (+),score=1.98 TRINITY_DN9613_c0_g1_i1:342-671(+)
MATFMDESRAGPAWNITVFPRDTTSNDWWWCSNYNVWYGNGASLWWGWSGGDGCAYVNVSPGRARCVRGPVDINGLTVLTVPSSAPSHHHRHNHLGLFSLVLLVIIKCL